MGRAIGIDLGTTNSVAAIKTRTVIVLQNVESQDLTPSVVGMHKQQVIVGQLALDRAALAPKDTIYSVKRLMGRGFRDKEVQKVRELCAYQIVEPSDGTDADVRVVMDGKQYSPPQISAMILKKVKEDAEKRLENNDKVEYAVITVPAYFTEKQKDATRKAGQLAGLKVQKILDEPTAAAIAFGIDNVGPDEAKTILVYDLGGGTFDVSVLTIVGGTFAQLNIEGDPWLGGDDFDRKIMDHVLGHIESVHKIDARKDARFMVKLKETAERAKKNLSTMNRTDILIPNFLKKADGDFFDVEMELSRAQFERMIEAQVNASIDLVHMAIKNAGETMTPDQIDHVLLVGGSSYIPLVRKSLAAVFGEAKLLMNVDPMKCVAFGAAALSAKWAEKVECAKGHVNPGKNIECEVCHEVLDASGSIDAFQVTGMAMGVQAEGDSFEVIIPKGSAFPSQIPFERRFVTPRANLKRIRVPIYAGFDSVASNNELQAIVWLELPENVPARTPLNVAFKLDDDGILEKVRVSLVDGSGVQVETYLDRGDTPRSRMEKKIEQLRAKRDQASGLTSAAGDQFEDLYARATKALSANDPALASKHAQELEAVLAGAGAGDEPEWKRKAIGLCNFTEVVLGYSFLLDPPRTQQLKTLLEQLQGCLNREDPAGTEKKRLELDKATDDLPGPIYLLLTVGRSIGTARSKKMDVEANQLRVALTNIEAAMRGGDLAKGVTLFEEIKSVMDKVGNTTQETSKETGEALVGKA